MAISVWGPGPSPYKPHTHSHTAFTIVGHGQLCQLFPCLRFACFEDLIDSYVILCVLCTVSKVNLRMRKSDLIGLAWHFLSRLKTNSSFKKWLFIYMDFLKSTVSAYTNVRCVTANNKNDCNYCRPLKWEAHGVWESWQIDNEIKSKQENNYESPTETHQMTDCG